MGSDLDLTLYRVEARVPTGLWDHLGGAEALRLPELSVDRNPPSSGPEVALHFNVCALSEPAAELRASQRLQERGLTVLAIKVASRV